MIAKRYGITVEDLMSTNHLVSTMIYPNQILFIPRRKEYITKTNDSIKDIIDKYSLTLKDISNLKVEPNQSITYREEESVHVVRVGETIEDIMAQYHLSPLELLKLNENKIVCPGEKVIIKK